NSFPGCPTPLARSRRRLTLPRQSSTLCYALFVGFATTFKSFDPGAVLNQSLSASPASVRHSLSKSSPSLIDFGALISPVAADFLTPLSLRSQQLTQQRFGKVIRLFAPLYLSNECINNCKYCGFSRDNPILRVTLSVDEVLKEARELLAQGFRN